MFPCRSTFCNFFSSNGNGVTQFEIFCSKEWALIGIGSWDFNFSYQDLYVLVAYVFSSRLQIGGIIAIVTKYQVLYDMNRNYVSHSDVSKERKYVHLKERQTTQRCPQPRRALCSGHEGAVMISVISGLISKIYRYQIKNIYVIFPLILIQF